MKLSISNIAWEENNDLDMYSYLHKRGYAGLEIAPTRIYPDNPYHHLVEAKDWALFLKERYLLEISSMQSIWYGHVENMFTSKEGRSVLIDYTKRAVDFAEVIGCKNLVFGNPRNRDTNDLINDLPIAVRFFREIGDYATEHHTTIALEPNPLIYNTRFINLTREAVEVADRVSSPGIKVNIDLGTMIYNREDLEYLKQISEFINHVHISEPQLTPIVPREMHISLFRVLKEINYKNYISIEMKKTGDLGGVQAAVEYIKVIDDAT